VASDIGECKGWSGCGAAYVIVANCAGLRQSKVENPVVTAVGDENGCGFDVTRDR
jgi:hypothetical protein